MHSPNTASPGGAGRSGTTVLPKFRLAARVVKINKYFIQHSGQRLVMLYWYSSRERIIASEYLGKISW